MGADICQELRQRFHKDLYHHVARQSTRAPPRSRLATTNNILKKLVFSQPN